MKIAATPEAAKKMLDETGCAGVSIGRGAFYDPWIFKRTWHYLQTSRSSPASRDESAPSSSLSGEKSEPTHVGCYDERGGELLPEPSFDERVRVMSRHLDLMIEVFGEELGCRMFRKVAPWYARRFGPCHEFNRRVVLLSCRAQFDEILDDYGKGALSAGSK